MARVRSMGSEGRYSLGLVMVVDTLGGKIGGVLVGAFGNGVLSFVSVMILKAMKGNIREGARTCLGSEQRVLPPRRW